MIINLTYNICGDILENYSIRIYKEYFNFSSAHFLVFEDGKREPLHGHNYRVRVKANSNALERDMVVDFCHIKPIVKKLCDSIDHKFLLPIKCPHIKVTETVKNIEFTTPDESFYSFPKDDVILMPIENISSERLAIYLSYELSKAIKKELNYTFKELEVEVEETPGQSAQYILKA